MTQSKVLNEVLSWGKAFIVTFFIAIFLTTFIFQPYKVSGSSMDPTFDGVHLQQNDEKGDHVLAFKSAYIFGNNPSFADIVIVDRRINRERTVKDDFIESAIVNTIVGSDKHHNFLIKRVIGEPGDTLSYKDGSVYRNGEKLEEDYIKEKMAVPFEKVTVPEGHVYVMGDNRNISHDSRAIGPVPIDHIVGKVFLRYYPFNKISFF
ncbi:signal peptidase I [Pontibacillus sp. HMF3514]|uniref:signal peptidase I n=1 Tax=Pontibacillus sp. HMF3514 TaxID=2692425 RepID=UPI00131F73B3|nr:signal peptidase I [Pontibacillus sp. HMF3514]QHE51218.1 signal peptidase I [Pontibacillus sp. HMF3514]